MKSPGIVIFQAGVSRPSTRQRLSCRHGAAEQTNPTKLLFRLSWLSGGAEPTLYIEFDDAEILLMAQNSLLQGGKKAFGGEMVHHQTFVHLDGLILSGERIGIQGEINNHLFRGSGDPTEIGIWGIHFLVIKGNAN